MVLRTLEAYASCLHPVFGNTHLVGSVYVVSALPVYVAKSSVRAVFQSSGTGITPLALTSFFVVSSQVVILMTLSAFRALTY